MLRIKIITEFDNDLIVKRFTIVSQLNDFLFLIKLQ